MVKTRWNTVATVLDRALELKPILAELCDMHRFNGERSARLRRYILSDAEWAVLEQLHRLLDVRVYPGPDIKWIRMLIDIFHSHSFLRQTKSRRARGASFTR